ncbi:hypothetical protein [Nocardia sp. NPDC059691]
MSTTAVSNVVVIAQEGESGPVCRVSGSRAGCGPARAGAATTVRA